MPHAISSPDAKLPDATREEIDELRRALAESEAKRRELEQTLAAITDGRADGLILVDGDGGTSTHSLEASYRALAESMAEGVAMLDDQGVITWANSAAAELLDAPLSRVIGGDVSELIAGALGGLHDEQRRAAESLLTAEARVRGEIAGRRRRLQLAVSPLSGGRRAVVFADLGERERRSSLTHSEWLTASILENVADAVIVCDLDGRIVRTNPAADELCAAPPLGRRFTEAFPLELGRAGGEEERRDLIAEVVDGLEPEVIEAGLRCEGDEPGSPRRNLVVSLRRLEDEDGAVLGCVITMVDISIRKRSERFLQRSEQRFRTSIEAMLDCFGVYLRRPVTGSGDQGPDFVVAHLNAAARREHVLGSGQRIGGRLREILAPELSARLLEIFAEVVEKQREFAGDIVVPVPGGRPDALERRFELRVAPLEDGCVAVWRDVSRERRLESELLASEERFLLAAQGARLAIWDCDLESGEIVWFGAPRALLGIDPRVLGTNPRAFAALIDEADLERVREELAWVLAEGEVWSSELRVRQPDESTIWVAVRGDLLRNQNDEPTRMIGVCIDISDRKLAEARQADYERELAAHRDHLQELVHARTDELEQTHERLRLSERMASIGTLSAGLGHDMGNILLPIRARLDAIEAQPAAAKFEEDLGAIRASVMYLQKLSTGLRMLALDPNEDASPAVTDFANWWAELDRLLANSLPKDVELIHEIEVGLPEIDLARHRLTQVIFNLVQNAGNAMRNSGEGTRVRVEARRVPGSEPATVCIRVIDDGPGMDEEVRRRCLEAFFTTGTRRYSTGLGLTLAHGVVKQAGGTMVVHSELGEGTRFDILLPAAEPESVPEERSVRISVTLEDARMRAYMTSLVRSLDARVEFNAPAEDTRLWITDAGEVDAVCEFLQEQPRRRAIVFGEHERDDAPAAMITLPARARPAELRTTLRELVRRVQSEPHPLVAQAQAARADER